MPVASKAQEGEGACGHRLIAVVGLGVNDDNLLATILEIKVSGKAVVTLK